MSLLHHRSRRPASLLIASLLAAGLALAPAALADSGTRFIRSAVVNGDHTVTLPLLRGTSGGQTVWYVVLDASTSNAADRYGANRANIMNRLDEVKKQLATAQQAVSDLQEEGRRSRFQP